MSKENNRTPEEIAADIKLKEAEALKMEADAKNVDALAKKNEFDASKAEIELMLKQLDYEKQYEKLSLIHI